MINTPEEQYAEDVRRWIRMKLTQDRIPSCSRDGTRQILRGAVMARPSLANLEVLITQELRQIYERAREEQRSVTYFAWEAGREAY